MNPDDLATGGDFNGVANDGDLDLTASLFVPDPVVCCGEADTAGGVDLADHDLTNGCLVRSSTLRLGFTGQCFLFFGWPMLLRMSSDQNASMADRYETVSDRYVNVFAGQPHPDGIHH